MFAEVVNALRMVTDEPALDEPMQFENDSCRSTMDELVSATIDDGRLLKSIVSAVDDSSSDTTCCCARPLKKMRPVPEPADS